MGANCDVLTNISFCVFNLAVAFEIAAVCYKHKHNEFVNDPKHGRTVALCSAFVMLFVAIFLLSVSDFSHCDGFTAYTWFGLLMIFLGFEWLHIAYKLDSGVVAASANDVTELPPIDLEGDEAYHRVV